MKKLVFSIAFFGLMLSGCTSSDDEGTTPPPTSGELRGDITSDRTIAKGSYKLEGVIKIKSGVTLTFDAGSTITSDVSTGFDAILVENGGKLIMNGTVAEPIVCTNVVKSGGQWGGIIIYGDAPIVGSASATSSNSEDGITNSATTSGYTYGGSNPTHSSGSLKYVRVEYAGKKYADGTNELNGFSFYAVGSGTVLENLVSYKGNDDGFEFYGGTVSATNLISYGNADDSFDWQDGWRGELNSNWYAYQVGVGNFGMEIEAKSVNNAFGPKVSNITLKRAAGTITEGGSSAAEYDAIQFKKQGNGEYTNILISGYTTSGATAVRIQDAATNTDQVNSGKIKLLGVKINDGTSSFGGVPAITVNFPLLNFVVNTTASGATLTPGAWSTVDGVNLLQ